MKNNPWADVADLMAFMPYVTEAFRPKPSLIYLTIPIGDGDRVRVRRERLLWMRNGDVMAYAQTPRVRIDARYSEAP